MFNGQEFLAVFSTQTHNTTKYILPGERTYRVRLHCNEMRVEIRVFYPNVSQPAIYITVPAPKM